MDIEPANINQVRLGEDGRVVEIDRDVGNVARDLRDLDPGLKVRFAERGKCWVVYHEHHPGCPHNGTQQQYLVKSIQAHQGRTGAWTGLDQRLVDRLREIRPGGGYDYVQALERAAKTRAERQRKQRAELFGEMAEHGAHAIRKDLGARYQGRAFIPNKESVT